jgi:dihydroorotate dehydrogenase
VLAHLYPLLRPCLFQIEAEAAHRHTLSLLRLAHQLGVVRAIGARTVTAPRTVMGLRFNNAVGLAAGLDKDGRCIDGLAALGFGFIEVGTVTPRAQAGNPRPRLFRLHKAGALINRLGFNNSGVDALLRERQAAHFNGVLGINIGKNADTPMLHAADDYLYCLERVYPFAGYVAINISSPNTQQLRQLQNQDALDTLLARLKNKQRRLADQYGREVPLALKVAPDLDDDQIKTMADIMIRHHIDAVIATNTTTLRPNVDGLPHAHEKGGLSGQPIGDVSTAVIRKFHAVLGDSIPIIGVGGIFSAEAACAKMAAGAALIQLYTGLIYRGPALVHECAQAIAKQYPQYR